jgi:hypothetical protein
LAFLIINKIEDEMNEQKHLKKKYVRPNESDSKDQFVAQFVTDFRRTGLLSIKKELADNPGKSLKEIMQATGEWDSFVRDEKKGGYDPELDVAKLESDARALG